MILLVTSVWEMTPEGFELYCKRMERVLGPELVEELKKNKRINVESMTQYGGKSTSVYETMETEKD